MNEGSADRMVRVLAGIILALVAWFTLGLSNGTIFGIVIGVVAFVLLVTGVAGFCPAYKLLGLRTCSVSPKKNDD